MKRGTKLFYIQNRNSSTTIIVAIFPPEKTKAVRTDDPVYPTMKRAYVRTSKNFQPVAINIPIECIDTDVHIHGIAFKSD